LGLGFSLFYSFYQVVSTAFSCKNLLDLITHYERATISPHTRASSKTVYFKENGRRRKHEGRRCIRAHKCLMSRMHLYRRPIYEVEMNFIVILLHHHRLSSEMFIFLPSTMCLCYNFTLDACALATPRVVPLPLHQNRAMLVM
jgi:hypothetical protein